MLAIKRKSILGEKHQVCETHQEVMDGRSLRVLVGRTGSFLRSALAVSSLKKDIYGTQCKNVQSTDCLFITLSDKLYIIASLTAKTDSIV